MTVGVLGGGQLGRMLALAGYPLGQRFVFLDPGSESSAGQVGDLRVGAYDDVERLAEIARRSDVVTYEFESVPVASARFLADRVPVFPPPRALEVSQDRFVEKTFFEGLGIPTAPFVAVSSRDDLERAKVRLGLPIVLKTRRFGYDGKGQIVLRSDTDLGPAWDTLGSAALIAESFVAFDREMSILAVRGKTKETRFYPMVENEHEANILRASFPNSPAVTPGLVAQGEAHAAKVLAALEYVGVIAIEFFVVGEDLVANELAPRVHNSGHWTIEGAEVSQFENHVRAILGMPLGSTAQVGHSAMVNVIGQLPSRDAVLRIDGAHYHSYGKDAAPGRKIGHVTVRADTRKQLEERLALVRPLVRAKT